MKSPGGIGAPEEAVREIVNSYERRELLGQLGHLSLLYHTPEIWPSLTTYYRGVFGRFGPPLDAALWATPWRRCDWSRRWPQKEEENEEELLPSYERVGRPTASRQV